MISVAVVDNKGKKVEDMDLPESIFGRRVNTSLIHQASVMYHASQRQGNASTKERSSVSGGGKKPFRQKGTGRARAGSIRSPLWRGGGIVFGPHPRDFGYSVPKKIRIGALREIINAKHASKDLLCIDRFEVASSKTKDFAKILKFLKIKEKTLALVDKTDSDIIKVSRNIPFFTLKRIEDVNAFDILKNKKIIITKAALKSLLKRIS